MFSDDRNDVDISIHIDCIEKLIGIALAVVVFQYLNEIAAFNQRDDLLEADFSFPDEPSVLVGIKDIVPFFYVESCYDDVCLLSALSSSQHAG